MRTGPPQTADVMTTDAVPTEVDAPREAAPREAAPRDQAMYAMEIGAHDANIFLCPRCTRPLAVGVSRCAGCRTRLVAGVPLLKVSGFIGMGFAVGVALAFGLLATLAFFTGPTVATIEPPVAVVPSAAPGTSAAPGPVDPTVPRAAVSALRQSTLVNQRLLSDQRRLARAMRSSGAGASELAPVIRSLAWTISFGDDLGSTISTWPEATSFAKSLDSFYGQLSRIADDGLSASITNDSAYRDAGRRMLIVLERLTAIDKASRALAAKGNIELPPLTPA
jgi:hypothetical protein